MSSFAPLASGDALERYVVECEIGRGGMAVVYRVRHTTLGVRHALKVLSIPGEGVQSRLLQEGRVQAAVRHPNIVAVFDVLDVRGAPGLLMEYVDGPALDWALADGLSVDEAERLFRGVLAGVHHAHENGLIHRDLKPANVLLAQGDGGRIPKVTDFGLAKVLQNEPSMRATRSNVAMGTPDYMAPEQIRDAAGVDRRADVFALGVILYELVCGRRPFEGPDTLTILNAIVAGAYTPPEMIAPDLPPRIVDAIHGCLQVQRDWRLPDCEAVLAVLDGHPVRRVHAAAALVGAMAPLSMPMVSTATPRGATVPDPSAIDLRDFSSQLPSHGSGIFTRPLAGLGLLVGVVGLAVGIWAGGRAVGAAEALGDAPVAAEVVAEAEGDAVSVVEDGEADSPDGEAAALPPARHEAAGKALAATAGGPAMASAGVGAAEVEGDGLVDAGPDTTRRQARRAVAPEDGAGHVSVVGARGVELESEAGRWPAGDVPAGTYRVLARFAAGAKAVPAGTVTVRPGETLTLRCVQAFQRCR